MQPKSFGRGEVVDVAQRDELRVGERLGERLAGTGEVLVADDDEHREVDARPAARG